jgi:ParB-like chromosome segregation protein Spo0J
MGKMEIIRIKIADIKRNPKNAKIHTPEQVRQIANSIERFGFNDPVGIAGDDNWLVEGDGRLQAQELLGKDEIDAIRLDHLTDEERRAYALAHNQTTLSTNFDFPALQLELGELSGFDMGDFGFNLGGRASGADAPDEFLEFDETIEAKNVCPKCKYEW